MISRWKGYLLRLVYGDLRDWDILPVFMGNFLSLDDLHRFGILLWCSRQPQWYALRRVIVFKYPAIDNWIGGHCNEWYLEDLSVNFVDDMKQAGCNQKYKWQAVFSKAGRYNWRDSYLTSSHNEIIKALSQTPTPVCEKEQISKALLGIQCGCLTCLGETEVEHWRNYPNRDPISHLE